MDEVLAGRRVALDLGGAALSFHDAMAAMEKGAYEGLLSRVGSRRLPREDVLDAALRIEALLARADPLTADERARAPGEFDRLASRARAGAGALARATAAGELGETEAAALLTSCVECHRAFRKRR